MYRGIVIFALATVLLVFFASDTLIERKHQHIANAAARSDAIVRSLFPGSVADRLYQKHTDNNKNQSKKAWRAKGKGAYVSTQKSRISSALQNPLEDQDPFLENEPLADLYPSASVIFAGKCVPAHCVCFCFRLMYTDTLLPNLYYVVKTTSFKNHRHGWIHKLVCFQ